VAAAEGPVPTVWKAVAAAEGPVPTVSAAADACAIDEGGLPAPRCFAAQLRAHWRCCCTAARLAAA